MLATAPPHQSISGSVISIPYLSVVLDSGTMQVCSRPYHAAPNAFVATAYFSSSIDPMLKRRRQAAGDSPLRRLNMRRNDAASSYPILAPISPIGSPPRSLAPVPTYLLWVCRMMFCCRKVLRSIPPSCHRPHLKLVPPALLASRLRSPFIPGCHCSHRQFLLAARIRKCLPQ